MTSVTLPSTAVVSFKYDPLGRRIQKATASATTIYAYDGENMVEETNATGAAQARFAMGLSIDEPLAQLRIGTTHFYNADGLGSVTSLTTGAGAVAASYTYDTFGNLAASSGSVTNPFRYTAREWDGETGLYFYRARYYSPVSGRFLTEDPIDFAAGPNFYRYVSNSTPNLNDPTGLRESRPPNLSRAIQDLAGQIDRSIGKPIRDQINRFGAALDFVKAYRDMRQANWKPGQQDKYLHCLANCEASKRGPAGIEVADQISEAREWFDEAVKGDSKADCDADRAANYHGRMGPQNTDCRTTCSRFRPPGLPKQY